MNKRLYNSIEKIGDLGLEDYDAQFRELDPQIGRWWEIDPKVDNMEMCSPYASNYDNPITYKDPLGDEGDGCCRWINNVVKWINNNLNPLVPIAEFVTGKSLDSDFTEDKPRSQSIAQAATFLIPTAKVESILVNEVKNVIINQVEKQTLKKIDQEALKRGVSNEVKTLTEDGLTKNTKASTVLDSKTGKNVTTIPDSYKTNSATVEVKDVKVLSDSKQLRAQRTISAQSSQKATVITGTNTHVSQTVRETMNVERKKYLGPQTHN